MTLLQLIGELVTLSHAYPDTTPVRFHFRDIKGDVVGVVAQSDAEGVTIVLEEQA